MPRLVDHDERRRAIIEAAWRLLATRGIDGVNMRDLATEAGYTNGALSHYFAGKDEILRTSYEYVIDATNARIEASVGRRRGRAALRKLCHEIMPLTEEATLEARIAMSLWQRAMTDELMVEVNNAAVADWKARMARHWQEAIEADELAPRDVAAGVELLMTTIIGLQVTAVLDPTTAGRRAQIAMVDVIIGQRASRAAG
ncbi:TetR/AcrR family transcriptional regulator [Gordonia sp. OPL2]|uniref:TetR/AcrR family transcriptional regulator n=1 Tax=Gordonia sp. OPL2 TaxID=2486274 RepID=UPI001655A8A8|nr:TetR/AcrR family transcriptional regulator [Gordonia sp. OPL2]ROZ89061.1 TetR/AcrR family transcriptional regulator [Gordonia sp. OPL2]